MTKQTKSPNRYVVVLEKVDDGYNGCIGAYRGVTYFTKTRLKFGDFVFINKNGYAQKRKTEMYVGRAIKMCKYVCVKDLIKAIKKLK